MSRMARPALFLVSALCYSASLVPLGGVSKAQDFPSSVGDARRPPRAGRMPDIVIRRDPFAGEPEASAPQVDGSDSVSPALAGTEASPQTDSFDRADTPERVPDIGDVDGAAPALEPPEPIVVRATIVGPRAVAYIDRGGLLQIVRVGDRLARHTIARIDVDGIAFDDGSRLDLIVNDYATSPPAAPSARPVTLDELRGALAPLGRSQRPAASRDPRPTPEPQREATTYPTPGPLPTVDLSGHDPSFVPTSDPRRPTPYPVPGIDR